MNGAFSIVKVCYRLAGMLRAVIFDFNGVIVDDERLHCRAFRRVLGEEGVDWFSETDYFGTYLGLDDRGCIAAVLTDDGRPPKPPEVDLLVERKAVYYFEELGRGIPLFPGVPELVARLAAEFPLAICSGARQREIEYILEASGLRRHFRVITSADAIHAGKPDPAGYLATLRALEESVAPLAAAECLVVEDAPKGIEAAHAAGMRCLAVATSRPEAELRGADLVVASLGDVQTADLLPIFAR
jgi:HAD superfamily hydrolase (TIGR01509 family)